MTKKWCVFLMLIAFAIQGMMLSAAETPDKDTLKKVQKAVKNGDSAFNEKKYEKAIEAYNEALKLLPDDPIANLGMGRVYYVQQKYDDAIPYLEKAVKKDPNATDNTKKLYLQTLFNVIRNLGNQGKVDAMTPYYVKVVELPGIEKIDEKLYVDCLFQVGYGYFNSKEYDKANEYFLKVVNEPNAATLDKKVVISALFQLGLSHSSLGKNKEALDYFLKVIQYPGIETESNQLYLSAYYLAGVAYNTLGEYEKSNEYLIKFTELAGTSSAHAQVLPMAYVVIGANHMTLLQKKADEIRKSGAKDQVKQVAEIAKKDTDTEKYLLKALELNPSVEEIYVHLGNYYYYCNELDKSIDMYQKLIDKFPNSSQISTYKSFLENRKKEKEQETQAKQPVKTKKAPKK